MPPAAASQREAAPVLIEYGCRSTTPNHTASHSGGLTA